MPPLPPLTVLLTGATGTLGRAISHRFASAGYSIFCISRSAQSSSLIQSWRDSLPVLQAGQRHGAVEGKITNAHFWDSGIRWTAEPEETVQEDVHDGMKVVTLPTPWILINAAGLVHRSLLSSSTIDSVVETLDTNLLASIYACRAFASRSNVRARRVLCKQYATAEQQIPATSSIVNVSSLLGVYGGQGAATYAASKAGLIGMAKCGRQDCEQFN